MALGALTDEDRITLGQSERFKELAAISVANKANYWMGQNGTNIAVAADATRWAKSHLYAAVIQNNPSSVQSDQSIPVLFQYFVKNSAVWDYVANPAFDVDACIDLMVTNLVFEILADNFFDEKIKATLF